MNDTSPEMMARYHQMLMQQSPERRLQMGCSMFDTAKQIVRSSILEKSPAISSSDLKKSIFLRFYGQEFKEGQKEKILALLGEKAG